MLKALFKEMGRSLRRASPSPSDDPALRHDERIGQFRDGDLTRREALITELQALLQSGPDDAVGQTLLGDWLLQLGRAEPAEVAYRRALQLQALSARAQEGLGLALLRLRRLEEAYLHLETAHRIEPMNAEVLTHWGLVDLEMDNLPQAASKFQRATERDANNPHAWHNLGLVALKQGRVDTAIELIRRALVLRPDHGLAQSNLAMALRRAERLDEALAAALEATRHKAGSARVWVVLADIQMNLGEFEAAEATLAHALSLDARHVGTHVARGKLLAATDRCAEAEQAFETALRIQPDHADAQGGLGEVHLLQQRWASGWDLYEARRRVENSPVRRYPELEWRGRDEPAGLQVLVHAEQGMGDIILFASCLPDLMAQGARCVLEVRPRLQALMARSFPEVTVVGRSANCDLNDWPAGLPAFDRQLPIGSLPRWFRRQAADFPVRPAYLKADPERIGHWHAQLVTGARRRIGIAWRGGVASTARHQRSLQLAELALALHDDDVQLVCLQYGDVDAELAWLAEQHGITVHPGLSGLGEIDDMAALTVACDAIVTVCSTQAHLTGALGRPGLVLVPSNPSWRYLASGEQTPWYPSLQLVRQGRAGDWAPVLGTLRSRLRALTAPAAARGVAA